MTGDFSSVDGLTGTRTPCLPILSPSWLGYDRSVACGRDVEANSDDIGRTLLKS